MIPALARCVEFCRRLDPDFPASLRGASEADIAALERASGRALDELHRAFLATMGESTGSFSLGPFTTSPSRLVAARAHRLPLAGDVVLFAIPTGDDDSDVLLLPDGTLRRDDAGANDVVAGSIEELICVPMLNRFYTARQPLRFSFIARAAVDDALAACRRIGALFGFETYWFSNAMTWAGRRKSIVLIAKQAPERYLSIGLAGSEEFEWGVIARTLERELDLEPYR